LRSDPPFHRVAHRHAAARTPLLDLGEDAVGAREGGVVGLGQDRAGREGDPRPAALLGGTVEHAFDLPLEWSGATTTICPGRSARARFISVASPENPKPTIATSMVGGVELTVNSQGHRLNVESRAVSSSRSGPS
jgi:hypothetical protein